ncbi:MAG TPA: GerMN domain-containing protein, partial [Candidatus Onthocola stercoravium]|nr:GerMN domain-containing protein [Candidatus Onthocola stercoravium]
MLKKMSIRKIIISTFTLFILLIIYLIPSNDENEIELKNSGVEYTYSNNLNPIYLLDSNDYVARTSIKTCACDGVERAKDLLEGLIIDGKKSNIIPNGFKSIIPPETQILDLQLQEGTLTINFSKELLDINEKYEEKMLEAIIYTLTSIESIDNVIIQVEGEPLTKLPQSGKQLPTVLDKSYGINKIYELTSTKDITSYTTYYVSTYNDNYYYVPVTKYINNENQDKIKVIIEEMSSAPIYESN